MRRATALIQGCYDSELGNTPNLDALTGESLVFRDAVASAPYTGPAHASVLTGLHPPQHGLRGYLAQVLPRSADTLAERFREAGYDTAAFPGTRPSWWRPASHRKHHCLHATGLEKLPERSSEQRIMIVDEVVNSVQESIIGIGEIARNIRRTSTSETEAAECSWARAYVSQGVRGGPRAMTTPVSKIPELLALRVG